jgi:hypothetical protein
MEDFTSLKEMDLPLHLQLSMRKAELAAQEMTWDQLQIALLNLYHQRMLELQAIKDMLQAEDVEIEFDIPTDLELTQLAISMMSREMDEEEDDEQPIFG